VHPESILIDIDSFPPLRNAYFHVLGCNRLGLVIDEFVSQNKFVNAMEVYTGAEKACSFLSV
jgi:hypothetical protein